MTRQNSDGKGEGRPAIDRYTYVARYLRSLFKIVVHRDLAAVGAARIPAWARVACDGDVTNGSCGEARVVPTRGALVLVTGAPCGGCWVR